MKIATWNVNSLKMRLNHVLEWLTQTQADILCLQELKMVDELFPIEAIRDLGVGKKLTTVWQFSIKQTHAPNLKTL